MIWKKYVLKTNNDDVDMVSAVLMDFGIVDIQIENNIQLTDEEMNQIYADFKKELPEDDGSCSVNFYLDEDMCIPGDPAGTGDSPTVEKGAKVDMEELEKALAEAAEIFGIKPVEIEETLTDTDEWEGKWKEYFKSFEVDGVIIKPSWEELDEACDGKVVVEIDPGMAFGTGLHETTRLCLKGLKKYMEKGDTVLDVGCGSGILGISALKLGASYVNAVDIDEQAVKVAYENFENNISEDEAVFVDGERAVFQLNVGDMIGDEKLFERIAGDGYDIVLVNILAEVVAKLLPKAEKLLKADGVMITSGILKEKLELITGAVDKNDDLEIAEIVEDGDWISVVIKRMS